jgi:two-component system response regulator LytT
MIKAVIIEDESLTANRLKRMLKEVTTDIEIISLLQTVKETLDWLDCNEEPDLYFMDIQLSDGLSFDIFLERDITKPVIFTTAFDEYAIKAFKSNGIDYLLKPVTLENISESVRRYISYTPASLVSNLKEILRDISVGQRSYKSNFLVEWREQLLSIPACDVAYFHLSNKMTHMITMDKKSYALTYSLDQLEKEIDPRFFYRINRQFIVSRQCIKEIYLYFGNRLKINLNLPANEDALVSRKRVSEFKEWLDT